MEGRKNVSDYVRGIDAKETCGDIPNPAHRCELCVHSRPHVDGKSVWCLRYSYPCCKKNTCVSFQHG